MVKRNRKKYSRPRKPFDKVRIQEENVLKERYGLKNKKEIWKADASIGRIRNLAKQLITKPDEEKKAFIDRLNKKGFKVENIAEALALDKEDYLKRRLQTVVFLKKLANTPKQARQLITHRHITIAGKIVNIPSYQVNLEKETQLKLNLALKLPPTKKLEIKDKEENVDEQIEKEMPVEKIEEVKEAPIEEKIEEVKETEIKEEKENA